VLRKLLGAKVIIEDNKSHINEQAGIMQLPNALDAILKLANL
jgi:hypothetical protein